MLIYRSFQPRARRLPQLPASVRHSDLPPRPRLGVGRAIRTLLSPVLLIVALEIIVAWAGG